MVNVGDRWIGMLSALQRVNPAIDLRAALVSGLPLPVNTTVNFPCVQRPVIQPYYPYQQYPYYPVLTRVTVTRPVTVRVGPR